MTSASIHPTIRKAYDFYNRWLIALFYRGTGFHHLRNLLDKFLRQGLDGAALELKDRKTGIAVEFRKYIPAKGEFGVRFRLRRAGEIDSDVRALERFCAEHGIATERETGSAVITDDYLIVNFGKDMESAHAMLVYFLADIRGLPFTSQFDVHLENMSYWDDLVDSPDHVPLSIEDGMNFKKERFNESGVTWGSLSLMALTSLLQVVGLLGLIFSLIFRWSPQVTLFEIAGIHVTAPIIGLIFAALVLIGFSGIFTDYYWLIPKRYAAGESTRLPKTIKNAFYVFWGRPFNWISLAILAVAAWRWISV